MIVICICFSKKMPLINQPKCETMIIINVKFNGFFQLQSIQLNMTWFDQKLTSRSQCPKLSFQRCAARFLGTDDFRKKFRVKLGNDFDSATTGPSNFVRRNSIAIAILSERIAAIANKNDLIANKNCRSSLLMDYHIGTFCVGTEWVFSVH